MFYQNNSHMSWEGPVIILKVQLWLFNWTVRLRLAFLFVGMPNYVQFFEKNNSNIVIAFLCMLNFKNLFSFLSFLSFFFFLRTRVIQVTNLQSQAKILGTLRANTVFFFPSSAFLFPPNTVYCIHSPNRVANIEETRRHKSAPTILTEIVTWCSRFYVFCIQFPRMRDAEFLHLSLMQSILGIFNCIQFPDAEFLHLSLMQSILGILYPVSQMQNFCILAWCSRF